MLLQHQFEKCTQLDQWNKERKKMRKHDVAFGFIGNIIDALTVVDFLSFFFCSHKLILEIVLILNATKYRKS